MTAPSAQKLSWRDQGRALLQRASLFARAERSWFLLAIPYLMAWWIPLSWLWRLFNPGTQAPAGIDGPVSWMQNWWGNAGTALAYQPFVPIGVGLLLWSRRQAIEERWRQLRRIEAIERKQLTRGNAVLLVSSCLLLFAAHLIHLSSVAILALEMIGLGVVVRFYGKRMLRPMALPMAYWLIMIPPPESLSGTALNLSRKAFTQVGAVFLGLLGKRAVASEFRIDSLGISLEISEAASGTSPLTATAAFFLWYGLYTRQTAIGTIGRMVFGMALAAAASVVRIAAAVLLMPSAPKLAGAINEANPWLLTVPMALITLGLDRWLQRRSAALESRYSTVLRPLGRAFSATARPLDRTLTRSGQAAGSAGRLLVALVSPLVWVTNQAVRGIEGFFQLLGKSATGIERGLKKMGRKKGRR